jgi:hypothetical protein
MSQLTNNNQTTMTRIKKEPKLHVPVHILIPKHHHEALQRLHPTLAEGVRRAIEEYLYRAEVRA